MGFFDTQGEKLYKETDRAMNDLMSVNSELKWEILENVQSLLSRLLEESARWSNEGKLKAARNLQSRAKSRRDFDVADYVSTYLAGAYLEALLLPSDPHATHVRGTIEKLVPSRNASSAATSKTQIDSLHNMIAVCLEVPLAVHYGLKDRGLADYIDDIGYDEEDITWRIYCIAFGLIDAVAQMKGMPQTEHLAFAVMFYVAKMAFSPQGAAEVVGRLIRIKPDSPDFHYIEQSGLAIRNYLTSKDLDEFLNLAELLASDYF